MPGLAQRFVGLLVRPTAVFERLRSQPVWIGPLVVAIAAGILVIVLLPDEVFVDSMRGATTRRGEPVPITSEPAVVALWERLRLALGVAVTHPIKMLLFAGFLTLAFAPRERGGVEFREFFSLAAHVWLIGALGAMLALPLQLATGDPGLQPSAALLVPGLAESGAFGRLMAAVNPFTVWMLATAAVGVAVIARRSARLPLLVLIGLYLVGLAGLVRIGA